MEDMYDRLPDLAGRTVAAVTTETQPRPPLNFVDPLTGKSAGWEYEVTEEILPPPELRGGMGPCVLEAMIPR